VTRQACDWINAPVALVTVIGRTHQYFKSHVGLPEPWRSRRCTPLSHSFCQYVVRDRQPLVVSDARQDARFRDHKAIAALNVVAYLGVPVAGPGLEPYGALCVIDVIQRRWTDDEKRRLEDLGAQLAGLLHGR
jgi:GAF domain-containing protein